ncbi:hypothetical protein PR048_000560 [Dryococelus australis]|uniref:Uncharacterized protein n=1 Tax=Dryococelus australis TaxID=614101 RepID=A0ABQ9IEZ8_9NEOP|nr:hypothetical protein PR048_000560 [Dryococelus australis]
MGKSAHLKANYADMIMQRYGVQRNTEVKQQLIPPSVAAHVSEVTSLERLVRAPFANQCMRDTFAACSSQSNIRPVSRASRSLSENTSKEPPCNFVSVRLSTLWHRSGVTFRSTELTRLVNKIYDKIVMTIFVLVRLHYLHKTYTDTCTNAWYTPEVTYFVHSASFAYFRCCSADNSVVFCDDKMRQEKAGDDDTSCEAVLDNTPLCVTLDVNFRKRRKQNKRQRGNLHSRNLAKTLLDYRCRVWITSLIEVLRADETKVRSVWGGAGMEGPGKREIPEKTRRPAASSGTIATCENSDGTRLDRGGRGVVATKQLTSYLGEPISIPGEVAPGYLHVRTVPDDASGRRVFSEIFSFPLPRIPAALHRLSRPQRPDNWRENGNCLCLKPYVEPTSIALRMSSLGNCQSLPHVQPPSAAGLLTVKGEFLICVSRPAAEIGTKLGGPLNKEGLTSRPTLKITFRWKCRKSCTANDLREELANKEDAADLAISLNCVPSAWRRAYKTWDGRAKTPQRTISLRTRVRLSEAKKNGLSTPMRVTEVSMEQRRNERAGGGEIPVKTRRPAASSGTIPKDVNPGETRPEISHSSPLWEASSLTAQPPWLSWLTRVAVSLHIRTGGQQPKEGCKCA